MTKNKADEKAKKIERAIRLAWGSMETHLIYAYGKPAKVQGNTAFHKKCVREYAEIINILSQLY